MAKRSNLIVSLGLAVFVAGAAATFFVVRNGDDKGSGKGPQVLYAEKTIPSGTSGAAAVDRGLVKTRSIDESAKPPTALTDPSQLSGRTATSSIPEGAVLTSDQFAVPQTRQGTLKIPDGKTAIAVQLANVSGVAGFVAAGDRVNIYGLLKEGPGSKSAKLIMQNTEVLNVSPTGTAAAPAGAASNRTFLLAVNPQEGERLAFLAAFQELYFALTPKDAAAVPGTSGTGPAEALKQLS